MADLCRNCYDLEEKIRDLERDAADKRVELRTLLSQHQEDLRLKERTIAEMDHHARGLQIQIQQFDRFYADCVAILRQPSMHSMLSAVLADYERIKGTENAPLEVAVAR